MTSTGSSTAPVMHTSPLDVEKKEEVYKHISNLTIPELRETALIELCKHRESMPDMALLLWNSFGVVCALVQEVCSIYPYMVPPTLTVQQSNRVCNALALLQCLASHPDTRKEFLGACIPQYLYNFLQSQSRTRQYEYLRLTSLGVIGALVKSDESEVIKFLLSTEMIPLCLKIMETGSELSKTVATFILQKILNDETGLIYMCQKVERLKQVNTMLTQVVNSLSQEPSPRLLKHVVRCYGRLADNQVACENLRMLLPRQLFEEEILTHMGNDPVSLQLLEKIRRSYDPTPATGAPGSGGPPGGSNIGLVPPPGAAGPATGGPGSAQQNYATIMAAAAARGVNPGQRGPPGTGAGPIPGGPAAGFAPS